jgi:hypothetical protein
MSQPWTPGQVAEIVLEADNIVGLSDGAEVLTWPGSGSASYDAVAVTGTAPTYRVNVLNGKPVVRFNGSQLAKVLSFILQQSNLALFVVAKLTAAGNYPMFLSYDPPVGWELRGNASVWGLQYVGAGGEVSIVGPGDTMSSWHIAEGIYNATADVATAYLDGISFGTGSTASGPLSGRDLWIGQRSDGFPLTGDIAAIVVVGSALADVDREKIEGYLAHKYGLAANLSAGHPYKSTPPTIPDTALNGGGILHEHGGGQAAVFTVTQKFDPEEWLRTATRSLKQYAERAFHRSVLDENGNYCGKDVYEIRMVWPGTEIDVTRVPLDKTIIHFEIDNLLNEVLGFGDGIFYQEYDAEDRSIVRQAAHRHMLNFDVGIWTSDRAGGLTMRLRAYEILNNIFHGSLAQEAVKNFTSNDDGYLELMEFTGGRFITERINDVNMYRTVETSLVFRVYSRTPRDMFPPAPAIEDIEQDPNLSIIT